MEITFWLLTTVQFLKLTKCLKSFHFPTVLPFKFKREKSLEHSLGLKVILKLIPDAGSER